MLATLILTTTSSFSTMAFAQKEKADVGKLEFEVHCAVTLMRIEHGTY